MRGNALAARGESIGKHGWQSKAIASGWNDYAKGLPFCAEYDTAGELWQRHYEMGRAEAAAARAVGRLPILRLNRRINDELGRCLPGQWPLAADEMRFHADTKVAA